MTGVRVGYYSRRQRKSASAENISVWRSREAERRARPANSAGGPAEAGHYVRNQQICLRPRSGQERAPQRSDGQRSCDELRRVRESHLVVERAGAGVALGDEQCGLLDAARRGRTTGVFHESLGETPAA